MYAAKEEREGVFRSLKDAILIERVSEVLEDLERDKKLTEKEKKLLKEGAEFLKLAKRGMQYTLTRKIDEHAVESCSAYGRTLKALHRLSEIDIGEFSRQSDIDRIFDESVKFLTKIVNNRISEIPREKLTFLQKLFNAIQEIITQEYRQAPETVLIKRGVF